MTEAATASPPVAASGSHEEASPRSTVLMPPASNDSTMATNSTLAEGAGLPGDTEKVPSPEKESTTPETEDPSNHEDLHPPSVSPEKKEDRTTPLPAQDHPTASYPTQTAPYYVSGGYPPEPPSPGMPALAYDGSFFQHAMPHTSPFGPPTPLSPPRSMPPGSPLFPRSDGRAHPHSPAYVSPSLSSMYYAPPQPTMSKDASEENGWDRYVTKRADVRGFSSRTHTVQHRSPAVSSMPYGIPRAAAGGRAYSFDEMLPPAALDQDSVNPAYSPYSPGNSANGTIFAQPSWGYPGPPDIMYGPPGSPLQPRPTTMAYGARGGYQYYPASSPGPPIQTTASNKGPEGANLFIFHIPNHFSNLDMYQLFSPYGNLLSVRIMVEKESGRSRGFGFVSYDSPESAALAIKELNGFAVRQGLAST